MPMTTTEAAAILQVSRRRINELIALGTITATKPGRDWDIDPLSVEAYKNSPRKSGPKPKKETGRKATARDDRARRPRRRTMNITHSDLYALKEDISHILGRALAGYTDDYKLITDGHTYIQWGKVEQDIHAAIDALIPDAAEPVKSNDAEDRYNRGGW